MGVKERIVEFTFGEGEKQFFDTLKCFFTSNLQLASIDNLPYSLDHDLAKILSEAPVGILYDYFLVINMILTSY